MEGLAGLVNPRSPDLLLFMKIYIFKVIVVKVSYLFYTPRFFVRNHRFVAQPSASFVASRIYHSWWDHRRTNVADDGFPNHFCWAGHLFKLIPGNILPFSFGSAHPKKHNFLLISPSWYICISFPSAVFSPFSFYLMCVIMKSGTSPLVSGESKLFYFPEFAFWILCFNSGVSHSVVKMLWTLFATPRFSFAWILSFIRQLSLFILGFLKFHIYFSPSVFLSLFPL